MGKVQWMDEVRLQACEPADEHVTFDKIPPWLTAAVDKGLVVAIAGDSVDGSDWTYLRVVTPEGEKICKTDDTLWIDTNNSLHVDTALHNRD